MHFQFNDGKYELITHNYMRSLWLLLILMAICSYLAQTVWSSLFNNDTMRALLALPGHAELPLVKRAQEAKAYETLMKIPAISNGLVGKKQAGTVEDIFEGSQLFCSLDLLAGEKNSYSHTFDYYPNQLIYLLTAARASASRVPGLRLRRKLLIHSLSSFFLTSMQFVLPWLFIGDKYTLYGLQYLRAWLHHAGNQAAVSLKAGRIGHKQQVHQPNSIDYELSSRIWPTLTMCQYKKFGLLGIETVTVQCVVAINEICAKLFAVIWLFIAINIVIEILALLSVLICSFSSKALKSFFGWRFWPRSKEEAEAIATFRHQIARKLDNRYSAPIRLEQLSERERKQLEAEQNSASKAYARDNKLEEGIPLGSKKWYLWCSRDIGLFLTGGLRNQKSAQEAKEDSNIYYLLYLLYLRLGRSKKKTELVITMTGVALKRYLESLDGRLGETRVAALRGNLRQQEPAGASNEQPGSGAVIVDVMM